MNGGFTGEPAFTYQTRDPIDGVEAEWVKRMVNALDWRDYPQEIVSPRGVRWRLHEIKSDTPS